MTPEKRTQNEAVFRAANERLNSRLAPLEIDGRVPFVCECSNADCLMQVDVTLQAYEVIRKDDARFFMLAGHEDLSVEDVVARCDGYLITEKHETPV